MKRLAVLFLAAALWPAAMPAQTPPEPEVFRPVADTPGLPRVLLIGDSISIGYTDAVRRLLAGKYNVHRIPENGATTANGVARIDKWLGEARWDVIHFNFGLHDLRIMDGGAHQVSLADYEANLRKLVTRMKQTGARLIWASTTPVPEGKLSPQRRSADVADFNGAARSVMQEGGVEINDLYKYIWPWLEKAQRPANVHFTPDGYEVLARQVAISILAK